jgi:chromate transporter
LTRCVATSGSLRYPTGGTFFEQARTPSTQLLHGIALEHLPHSIDPQTQASKMHAEVSLKDLFFCFLHIGVTSFGGSTQAWVHRAVVEERKWLEEEAYLAGLAVAQILPGANPVNISLYVGQRLRGGIGATVATLGLVLPAICIVLIVSAVYARLAHFPLTHSLLLGIATVGLGATLAAGTKVARRIERVPASILIAIATFIAVGVFRWSMVPVVAVLAPLSVYLAKRRSRG